MREPIMAFLETLNLKTVKSLIYRMYSFLKYLTNLFITIFK